MDPLAEYIQAIYNANRDSHRFVIDVAKVVEELNTKVFIPDHRLIVRVIDSVIREPHICSLNTARTHIEVDIIGK
jgi:hypothetical protein